MAVWTIARTWVTGELVTSSIMNTHVRDNLNYLYSTTGELGYTEFTAAVSTVATTEAGATTVVTAPAITFDGVTPVDIEFFAPWCTTVGATDGVALLFALYDGANSIGQLGQVLHTGTGASGARNQVLLNRKLTPTAASHTYSIRIWNSAAGTGSVTAGAGGSGNPMPGYIRVERTS